MRLFTFTARGVPESRSPRRHPVWVRYTIRSAGFLGLFGWASSKNVVNDPTDTNGPPVVTIPADVTPDKKNLYNVNCNGGMSFTPPSMPFSTYGWTIGSRPRALWSCSRMALSSSVLIGEAV